MIHVSELLRPATDDLRPSAATPAPPTTARPATIEAWEGSEWLSPFQTLGDPQLARMRREAAAFLHDMATEAPPRWLTLLGTSGAGKTMLGRAIHEAVRRCGLTRASVSKPRGEGLGTHFPAEYRIRWEIALDRALREREWEWLDDLCRAQFALVDEIALDLVPRKISAPKLAMLAERRLGRWTVLTGNVSVQTLKDEWDARIASRLLRGGSVVVDVDVPDFHLR